MAQLADDCFAFGGDLMRLAEARALIAARVAPVEGTERVAAREAMARVLAQDLIATVDVPGHDNSAVDGYAVRHADLDRDGTTRLPIVARAPAGTGANFSLQPGTAVRIFTGAAMPIGADTVFMQEDARTENQAVLLPAGLKAGANRRFAGEDFRRGDVVLSMGRRIGPSELAAAAALGLTALSVRRRVRVAIFSTGDEITAPGTPRPPGGGYDANQSLLAALCRRRGAEVTEGGILVDRPEIVADVLRIAAQDHDLILTSGGVSTGEEDHVRSAVAQIGTLGFWRLAIKPGRPVAMGTIGGAAFMGLPGNPVASFVTFVRVAAVLLDHLAGMTWREPVSMRAIADFDYSKKQGRCEYVRATLHTDDAGRPRARKYPREGAALIASLLDTDGLLELPEDITAVQPGDEVRFIPYGLLIG